MEALPPADLDALRGLITTHAAHLNAALAKQLSMIGELDARGGWGEWGLLSCEHWLSLRCGETPAAARELVRVAGALRSLPLVRTAFERGAICYSSVRTITRAATPETEDILLHVARYGTGSQLTKLCRLYRQVLAITAPEKAGHLLRRYVRFRYDDDGSLRIYGCFPADEGELIRRAFELLLEQLREEPQPPAAEEPESPSAEDDPFADVDPEIAEMLREVQQEDDEIRRQRAEELEALLGDEPPGKGVSLVSEGSDIEERTADAMCLMAETMLATSPKVRANPDRYLVTVLVDVDTLDGRANGRCELERGVPIPPSIARMLACDASLQAVTQDKDGNPLFVGRKTRRISRRMRRALRVRDPRCRYPECRAYLDLHGHHRVSWREYGRTDLPLLAHLCPAHHRAYHNRKFTIESPRDGVFVFRSPHGFVIGHDDPVGRIEDIADDNRHLDIDETTCRPQYGGEHADWSVAIDHLLRRLNLHDCIPRAG